MADRYSLEPVYEAVAGARWATDADALDAVAEALLESEDLPSAVRHAVLSTGRVVVRTEVQAQHVRIGDHVVLDSEAGRSVWFVSGILLDNGLFTLRCNVSQGNHTYIRDLPADRLVPIER